ncbi:L-rhamnose mutarotase [Arcticibacter tournemirensis]
MGKQYRLYLTILTCWLICSHSSKAAEIWVSAAGSDKNPGTKEKPVSSIHMALRMGRELRRLNDPSVAGGIRIILRGDVYRLDESLFVRPEDSGNPSSPTIIEAAPGEHPVLSGGVRVSKWQLATGVIWGLPERAKGNVWVADVPLKGGSPVDFRQLWIGDHKAVRAKDASGASMNRIVSWDHASESCLIPLPQIKGLSEAEGLEMFIHQWWAIAILRVKSIEMEGKNARLRFHQPESHIQSEHPWPAPWISSKTGNSAFYLSNAIQFLDEPGEWFFDKKNRKVYYWPRKNEDLSKAVVTVPFLETLVKMEGTADRPVSHVYFKGISFQHSGWLRPSKAGHVPLQAGMFLLDAYKLKVPGTPEKKNLENQGWTGRPEAAVEVSFSSHTGFEGCRFEHLASTGIDLRRGNQKDRIEGSLFKDIGGSAILAGVFSDESFESHLAYNPADQREVTAHTEIQNNLITDVTNEDWGCVGIGAGFVKGIKIEHNEINEVSYSGISVGWGWTKDINVMNNNVIRANKIHHYGRNMYDVAGIYTLSAQPGSSIIENYIDSIYKAPYAHDPHHWFYLYTDEGSSYFTVKDNWCPAGKFLQNANGPGNVWENNGPQVTDSIRLAAGLQEKYKDLLRFSVPAKGEINSVYAHVDGQGSKPQAIEISAKPDKRLDFSSIADICRQHGIATNSIFQWDNHVVIFDDFLNDSEKMQKKLALRFPDAVVKSYNTPFYSFSRKERCNDTRQASEWDDILLTANLVADEGLQKEYMDYHAAQFKKWPEVAKGFCNADFQRLLLFRNVKQLLLVISIPKGKNLDELNPLTTENNPRVDEWNALMKKYQEGIPGTKPGEVWVELKGNDGL